MISCTIGEVSKMLAERAESVCQWLLPQGKRNGHEWEVGSTQGEPGKSLKVNLAGKAGLWADFASGESGDLIDLILLVRGCTKGEAVKEAKGFLGVKEDAPKFTPTAKKFDKPNRPANLTKPDAATADFFTGRGISKETVEKFCVGTVQHEKEGAVMVFPYYHAGEVAFIKYRPVNNKKGMWTSANSVPCLFGMQLVPANSREIIIVEGELDAMAFAEAGFYAVSVPRGGGEGAKQDGWIDTHWEELQLFDTIYLALDSDTEGKLASEYIAKRLGQHRCFIMDFGPFKDANNALLAGYDFAQLFQEAKTHDPEELKHVTEYTESVIDFFREGPNTKGTPLPWYKTHERIRLRHGEVSVWAGMNGHGKSQVIGHVVSHSIGHGQKWCIASMEFTPTTLLARMFRQISATHQPSPEKCRGPIQNYLAGNLFLFDVRGTAKAKRVLEVFEYAAKRYGCTHFLIDSLAKCGFGEDDYNSQKAFVDTLADFALKNTLHIHLVCHSRKGANEDTPPDKMDVKGSGAITDLVDNAFIVWRNKPKEKKIQDDQLARERLQGEPDCLLTCCKQRHGEWEGAIQLWFDKASLQYLGASNEKPQPLYGGREWTQ